VRLKQMERRVVITGIGVISPLGDSLEKVYTALCEGQSGLGPVELFSTDGLSCQQAGEIRGFSPRAYLGKRNFRPLDRTSQIVTVAAQSALEASGWSTEMRDEYELGLVLGTMFCSVHTISEFDRRGLTLGPGYVSPMDFSNTVINAAAGQAAIWHNLRGVNSTISGGISSSLQAIGYATELVRCGQANALLAGGAEELCFESFYGFDRSGLLAGGDEGFPIPFDKRRNGFVLGEGSILLTLEDAEFAAERGATILGEIKGYGNTYDFSRGADESRAVEAIARAIRLAFTEARVGVEDVGCIGASANGSVKADRHEARGIAAAFNEKAAELPVTAVKSMLGEMLGASGAVQVATLLSAMRGGVLPGIRQLEQLGDDCPLKQAGSDNQQIDARYGLVNSIGLDGNCCSLIVARADAD
jgi:3-oxoacyl-[acyl-carrier-protein] synthase II